MTPKEIKLLAKLEKIVDKDPICISNRKLVDVYGLDTYLDMLDAADGCELTMVSNLMSAYQQLLAKYKTATKNTPKH